MSKDSPKHLSIGKLRGLQQIADRAGIFAMCAMDHRESMQRRINPDAPGSVSYATMVVYKLDLAECLAPAASALLLDPVYGAAQAIAAGAVPNSAGLLVSQEETGYQSEGEGRVTVLLPGWSVEKTKRMGASAAKLLLYYRPDLPDIAARQRSLVQQVSQQCERVDLPFVLEPLIYRVSVAEHDPSVLAERKADLVSQSARDLSPMGVDLLKAEFPADLRYEQDAGKLRAACERLDDACQTPWVLLSAGVSFDDFAKQVKIACQAGASGFLAGRAIWGEAMAMQDREERRRWLTTVGRDRLQQLHDLAGEYGRAWWKVWADASSGVAFVDSGWYQTY